MALAVLGSPAKSADIKSVGTFSELRAVCEIGDTQDMAFCHGFVSGAVGVAQILSPDHFCPGDIHDSSELIDVAFDILDDVPGFGAMPAEQGIIFGLGMAFPCPN